MQYLKQDIPSIYDAEDTDVPAETIDKINELRETLGLEAKAMKFFDAQPFSVDEIVQQTKRPDWGTSLKKIWEHCRK